MVASLLTASLLALSATSQQAASPTSEALPVSTAIPIVFTRGIDANKTRVGDPITARTAQIVKLPSGRILPAGSQVIGHVVEGSPFVFDHTPYAKQKSSSLGIHFENIMDHGQQIALSVYVRAIADPIATWDATKPKSTDLDPEGTTTQVGGDLVTPSHSEVINQNEDIVGYQHRGGIYAHLIAASGNHPEGCDGSDTEQSMGVFSASACGAYGFADTTLAQSGRSSNTSTLVLTSRKHAPKIYAHTTALLEVIGTDKQLASR
jgi:hypothetical protein